MNALPLPVTGHIPDSVMNDQRAVIDIGSNTVRLVVYGGPERVPTTLFNEKVSARLGKGVAETGLLADKSSAAALTALRRFAAILRLRGVTRVDTVATAAVRDAANGAAFLEEVARLGLAPRLLSGEEEALAAAMGVAAAFPDARGVVGDLGGGSLELTHIAGDQCEHGTSLPLGTLRLPQMRADGPEKFARRVHKLLIGADWRGCEGEALYLVGGACRAFARYAIYQQGWPVDDPHGYEIPVGEAQKVVRSLAHGKLVAGIPGLSSSRTAALPDTAALLGVLFRELQPEKLVFSSWGLREGVIAGQMSPAVRGRDPLLTSMAAFTASLPPGDADPATFSNWLRPIFVDENARLSSLRDAAIMLALASMQVEPNIRRATVVDWALRKRWIGITAEERAMLAMTALANGGVTAPPQELSRIAGSSCLNRALAWGLALRLARKFSGMSARALETSALALSEKRLVLSLPDQSRGLCTESVERELRGLANWLGLEPEITGPSPALSIS